MKKSNKKAARQSMIVKDLANVEKNKTAAAKALGVSRYTVIRDLKDLQVTFESNNPAAYAEAKQAQLRVWELMEKSLLAGKVDTDTAREWRGIRSEISKLLGLNAESRAVVAHVSADVDPLTMGRYRRFCHETRNLSDADLEKVYEFVRASGMNVFKSTPLALPERSDLWDEVGS